MNTVMLILSIGGFALHFLPSITSLFQRGGSGGTSLPSTPAPSSGSPTPSTGRPVLDLIHQILAPMDSVSPTVNIIDKDLQLLRQVLDNLGVKPLIPPSN